MQEFACEIASENPVILQEIMVHHRYARNMATFLHFLAYILQVFPLQDARPVLQVDNIKSHSCKNLPTCKMMVTLARPELSILQDNDVILHSA